MSAIKFDSDIWDWTLNQMNWLKDIAKRAREESKRQTLLSEKVRLQMIAERAEKGLKSIAMVFGEKQ